MKKSDKCYQCLLMFFLLWLPVGVESQEVAMLRFGDDCNFGREKFVVSETAKIHRVSSSKHGAIEVVYKDGNMPDSLRRAVEIATNVWNDCINIGDSVYLHVYFDTTPENDIVTDIRYIQNVADRLYYPSALYRNMYSQGKDFDSQIRINSSVDWCLGLGDDNGSNPKKMVPAMLQAIGRALGYGSSVKLTSRGNVGFYFRNGISVFDKLVFSEDGRRLENQSNKEVQEFLDFVQQEDGYLYVADKSESHQLYAPKVFEDNRSLKCSNDPSSTMYHGEWSSQDLVIDETTREILSTLGWNFHKESGLKIVGEDIDDTGITSAYQEHRFYIVKPDGMQIDDARWELLLPLDKGGNEIFSTSSDMDFVIPAISNEDKYRRGVEGDISGLVIFYGSSKGQPLTCYYNVTLELKPKILEANIVSRIPCSDDSTYYDVVVDVFYSGSHYVVSSIKEENSPWEITSFSNTPYYTRLKFDRVDSWSSANIQIITRNKYGSDTESLYLSPGNRLQPIEEIVPKSVVLEENETQEFSESCHRVCDWSAFVLKRGWIGDKQPWIKVKETSASATFRLSPKDLNVDWSGNVNKMECENGRSYYVGMVVCRTGSQSDTAQVLFDLVPTRPLIEEVRLSYDSFDFETEEFINPKLELDVKTERSKGFYLNYSDDYPPAEFIITTFPIVTSLGNDKYTLSDGFYADQMVCVVAENDYGSSALSDTVYFNDYIEDQSILDFLHGKTQGIPGVSESASSERLSHSIENGRLTISYVSEELTLFDMSGRMIRRVTNNNTMNIANISPGMYCIMVRDRNNKCFSKKIVL